MYSMVMLVMTTFLVAVRSLVDQAMTISAEVRAMTFIYSTAVMGRI